jgi:hypothetical protein
LFRYGVTVEFPELFGLLIRMPSHCSNDTRIGDGGATDLLYTLLGHPVTYNEFAVEVHNIECSDMLGINNIDGKFRYGWAQIVAWEASPSVSAWTE